MTTEAPQSAGDQSTLTESDRRILDFERTWWRHVGAKESAIRTEFGFGAARYYQVLNSVIDSAAAVRYDPILVGRLQRARDARTRVRTTRTFRISDTGAQASQND